MGKGRKMMTALRSNVTPTGRWAPPANAHARCVGMKLEGKKGSGVHGRFSTASKDCKAGK